MRNQQPKRTRIDPTSSANKSKGTASTDGNQPKQLTPTAAAKQCIKDHCESLSPHLATILERVANEHLVLLTKRHSKQAQVDKLGTIANLDPTNAKDMARVEMKDVPRSARINFKVTAPKEISEDNEFLALKEEQEHYMKTVHTRLTGFVKRSNEIQIKHINSSIDNSLAKGLHIIATAVTTENGGNDNPHQIVNSILDSNHESILKYATHNGLNDFRNGYKALHSLADLPNPEALPTPSPARRGVAAQAPMDVSDDTGRDESLFPHLFDPPSPPQPQQQRNNRPQPRTALQTLIVTVKRLYEQLLNYPFEMYLSQKEEADKQVALRQLETTIFTTGATEDAAMVVDGEAAPSPQTLIELIKKESQHTTAGLHKEISSLQKQLKKAGPNNSNSKGRKKNAPNQSNKERGRSQSLRRRTAPKQKEKANSNRNKNTNRGPNPNNNRRCSNSKNGRSGSNTRKPRQNRNRVEEQDSGTGHDNRSNNRNYRRSHSRNSSDRNRSNSRRGSGRPRNQSNRN